MNESESLLDAIMAGAKEHDDLHRSHSVNYSSGVFLLTIEAHTKKFIEEKFRKFMRRNNEAVRHELYLLWKEINGSETLGGEQ